MTLNLTELRDEPLGKHPDIAFTCIFVCRISGQDVVAADHESISTFDVDSLTDEALDARPAVHAFGRGCMLRDKSMTVSDEALDPLPPVNAAVPCFRPCYAPVDDASRDTQGRRA